MSDIILTCSKINKSFRRARNDKIHIIKDLDLTVYEEEVLGLVGESGCGKSTLGKILIQLEEADSGKVCYKNKDINSIKNSEKRKLKKEMQYIFQDSKSALNYRKKIGWLLEEPLKVHSNLTRSERKDKAKDMLGLVGLSESYLDLYPYSLSGGQAQRISILCSLMNNPELIIADEPVSALDLSIQAQILNLLQEIKKDFNLTMIFITHDLNVCYYIADRVAVMFYGRIVEIGDVESIYKNPQHPYTKELLESSFNKFEEKYIEEVDITNLGKNYCEYVDRCPYRMDICFKEIPDEYISHSGTKVRCFLYR